MAGTCTATKRNGEACTLPANGSHGLCWAHDPKNAERRRKGAARGGKAKAQREIPALKKQLEDLVNDVFAGRVQRGTAAVVNQLLNTRLRAIELERKIKEQDEVLERIEALEAQRGVRRWG